MSSLGADYDVDNFREIEQVKSNFPNTVRTITNTVEGPNEAFELGTNLLPRLSSDHFQCQACQLLMWGSGKDGRCGNNSEEGFKIPTHIKVMSGKAGKMAFTQLDCGYHHTAAVSDKGQIYTWGRGVFG